jgi:SpoVK/Ycf46/Vps4 family AAA+-type ATPase
VLLRALAAAGVSVAPLAPDASLSLRAVAGAADARAALAAAALAPARDPGRWAALGVAPPSGVLLYGPPGTGKTLLAKALAADLGAAFLSVAAADVLRAAVGASERIVAALFAVARLAAPCVLFVDEIDALFPARGGGGSGGGGRGAVGDALTTQLLVELNAVGRATPGAPRVLFVAATNAPGALDPALLRPGRLDRVVHVPLPSARERVAILDALLARLPGCVPETRAAGACEVAPAAEGRSGADLAALVAAAAALALADSDARGGARVRGLAAVRAALAGEDADSAGAAPVAVVTPQHLRAALALTPASVAPALAAALAAWGGVEPAGTGGAGE